MRLYVVEVTSPGCEFIRALDDPAAARELAASARRLYGKQHVRAWEL